MSNIERKYSYHDDGVLPLIGEYGVTYLTIYSSDAGNIYDGWIFDPDNKIPVSVTERTFGYRHPEFPQYCWDDEVTVDLSNAQSREESSEFAHGRIASFNTNVSSSPIILQDIDTTGLTESEREAKATTVLFTAIPLVSDAYIQAMSEIQMKVNLSEDNTSGVVRVEAFYILNNESDRTMRPNPVHTFMVGTENERHTLPFLYFNPALKHDTNNYIGVKLICTGGTAEIGISDVREYGDAIIILISAGLTGDTIFSGEPVSLEIFGLDEVPPHYELNIEDYTVLCTYDTGEIYDVTRLCTFNPEMGTEIVDSITTLTAHYHGLTASMQISLTQVDHIELTGNEYIYDGSYTLDISDYTVLAYFDNGDVWDVTDECSYSPPMGTTISSDTTLVATYTPSYMPGYTFTDSLDIENVSVVATGVGEYNALHYTLYSNGIVDVTGDSRAVSSGRNICECINLPATIRSSIASGATKKFALKWDAQGPISGVYLPSKISGYPTEIKVTNFFNFSDVEIVPFIRSIGSGSANINANPITINFSGQSLVTSNDLAFLSNVSYPNVSNIPVFMTTSFSLNNAYSNFTELFYKCSALVDLNFMCDWVINNLIAIDLMCGECSSLVDIGALENLDVSNVSSYSGTFQGCSSLSDISPISGWNNTNCTDYSNFMRKCSSLVDASPISDWDMTNARELPSMFGYSGIKNGSAFSSWRAPNATTVGLMFEYSDLESIVGLGNFMLSCGSNVQGTIYTSGFLEGTKIRNLIGLPHDIFTTGKFKPIGLCKNCKELENLQGAESLVLTGSTDCSSMFYGCIKLTNINAAEGWDMSTVQNTASMFYRTDIRDLSPTNLWNMSSNTYGILGMFSLATNPDADEVMNYQCSSTLFSSIESSLADNKVLPIDGLQRLKLTNRLTPIDYRYTNGGAFSGRDMFILEKISQTTYSVTFVNPNALPDWYKQRIEDLILAGKFYPTA